MPKSQPEANHVDRLIHDLEALDLLPDLAGLPHSEKQVRVKASLSHSWEHLDKKERWRAEVYLVSECDKQNTRMWWFDMEYDPQADYSEALEEMSQISRGSFQPANISTSWDDDLARVSYSTMGEMIELEFESPGDWFNLDFLQLVNSHWSNSLRFVCVAPEDQTVQVLALTDQDVKTLAARGWQFEGD